MDMEPGTDPRAGNPLAASLVTLRPRRRERLLVAAVLLGLAAYAAFYAVHAYRLALYPGDVDNIEGFVLYQGSRLAQGEEAYPALDAPPYLVDTYAPLYPLVLALGERLGAPPFAWARGVSACSILLVCVLTFFFVHGRTERFFPALVAALLIPATYHVYNWGALARVDSFGLLLTVLALLLVERERMPWLAAICFALATFTKPSFLAGPVAALVCGWLRENRREASLWFFIYLTLTVTLYGITHWVTGGRSTTQIFTYNINAFRLGDVFLNFRWWFSCAPALSALTLTYLLECGRGGRRDLASTYTVFAGLAALSVGKIGSGPNYFFELVLACCICVGLLLAESIETVAKRPSVPVYQSPVFINSLLIVQLLATAHWPGARGIFSWAWTPGETDRFECMKLERIYERAPGPVFAERPGLALVAGHTPWWQPFICSQLHNQGLWDERPVIEAFREGRFALVGLRQYPDGKQMNDPVVDALRSAYGPVGTPLARTILFAPHTPTPTVTPTAIPTATPTATPTAPEPSASVTPTAGEVRGM